MEHLRLSLSHPENTVTPLKSDDPHWVDLMGRLSNPYEGMKTLISQGSTTEVQAPDSSRDVVQVALNPVTGTHSEEKGRLSNPVQRRLADEIIDQLVEDYVSGLSINALARQFGIHRTTVMTHLEARGVQRRQNVRKLSAAKVALASKRYESGLSLASVAKEFGVNAATLTREFRASGIPIKPRRGWAVQNLGL